MNNLKVVPVRKSVDSYATGDYQHYNVFEVRRTYTSDELKKANYAQSVIDKGVCIEVFNSPSNAAIFVNAMQDFLDVSLPSNLDNVEWARILEIAEDFASDAFVKHGNKFLPFNENDHLRLLMGGKLTSYPQLVKIVANTYNKKLTSLIVSNL